jgi:uncharacterized protein
MSDTPAPAPVTRAERLATLDAVRGFALLGILLMNILIFGLPTFQVDSNPTVYGGHTGPNYWIWWIEQVFWTGKMRALFSLCFGAGVILLTSRIEDRGGLPGDIHYRRILWLLLFGLAHGYLIWWGDILYPYALIGLMLFPFRKLNAKALLAIGAAQILLLCAGQFFQARDIAEKDKTFSSYPSGALPTGAQAAEYKSWIEARNGWSPTPEEVQAEIKAYRGGYVDNFKRRAQTLTQFDSIPYYSPMLWDMMSMMFIGMALMKMGAIEGAWPRKRYWLLAVGGIASGTAAAAWSAHNIAAANFEFVAANFAFTTYQFHRLALSLGYLACIVLAVQSGRFQWLTRRLAAVGQMAFTNYIFHSLVCTTLFYGFGFGWFGKLQRYELYYVVAAIWIFQLAFSPLWLRRFRYGPIEWAWRSLTYWRRQPMRLAPATSVQSLPAENPA